MRTIPKIWLWAFSTGIAVPRGVGGPPTKNAISNSKSRRADFAKLGAGAPSGQI